MALTKPIATEKGEASYHAVTLVLIRLDAGYTRVKLESFQDEGERAKKAEALTQRWYKFDGGLPSVADCYATLKQQAEWADARDA